MMRLAATGTRRTPCTQLLIQCTACAKQTQHRCPWSQPRSITSAAKHYKASNSELCPSCHPIHLIAVMSLRSGLAATERNSTRNARLSRHGRPLQRSQAQRPRRTIGELGCEAACTAQLNRVTISVTIFKLFVGGASCSVPVRCVRGRNSSSFGIKHDPRTTRGTSYHSINSLESPGLGHDNQAVLLPILDPQAASYVCGLRQALIHLPFLMGSFGCKAPAGCIARLGSQCTHQVYPSQRFHARNLRLSIEHPSG